MMRDAHPVPLSPSDEFFTSRNIANDGHTAGVGTASYAAPEQITETQYGPEVDIFALGMILLELFSNFTSEHERAKAFHNCRHRRELEPWMHRTYPEVSALVLACTQPERSRRPTAKDIQNAGVFRQRGNCTELFRAELTTLKGEIAKRDSVIDEQRELLRAKDKEIEELRQRLSEMDVHKETDTNLAVDANYKDVCDTSDDDY
jgi:serine/threonine protein kinase